MYYLYKWASNKGKLQLNIFGCDLNIGTAIVKKIIDANCLNACDTPLWVSGTFPQGTIFRCDPSNPPPPANTIPLFIWF